MKWQEWKLFWNINFFRMKNFGMSTFWINFVEGLDILKLNFSEKVWRFLFLRKSIILHRSRILTSSLYYVLICAILIIVGRMSFLVSVSVPKTEKSMSKIVLNKLSLPNESCPDFPFLFSGELYFSFILCQEKLSFKGNFSSYAGAFLLFTFFLVPYGNLSQRVSVQFIHA